MKTYLETAREAIDRAIEAKEIGFLDGMAARFALDDGRDKAAAKKARRVARDASPEAAILRSET